MALSWVLVEWPTRRNVYVGGTEPSGLTNTAFRVETGMRTFFLRDRTGAVEAKARKKIVPRPKNDPNLVQPQPVDATEE